MTSRRRAATRRVGAALAVCLAVAALGALTGCSRSGASTGLRETPEVVVVYPAQLMSEHPLYPATTQLSARIAALTEPPDLRALRAAAAEPLARRLLGPPRVEATDSEVLTAWEAQANAALARQVQEAEASLSSWPQPDLAKTEARLRREADDAVRRAGNDAETARLRVELGEIERRRDELQELRRLAASEDRQEAAAALDRQAALWREIAARVEAARRDAEAELRTLREAGEQKTASTLEAAHRRAEAERAAHVESLTQAGGSTRDDLPEAVSAATARIEPAANAQESPEPPDLAGLAALVDDLEAEQRAAGRRRIERLVAVRTRLLREIALGTQAAVRSVAFRNGLEVRFGPETGQTPRDATEDLRPLLREYWAARPARLGPGSASRGATPGGARL
ncbi:MAG: hypothetical protein FJX74_21090 [Armatimonadetes bacterium]|nr:hypothetical protein [Armatimonadota bacterium]